MTNAPFPDSSELTREDFIRSGWKEILRKSPISHYQEASNDFSSAMSNAQEEGDLPRAKVFQILAVTCAMDLTNKSRSEPFEPWGKGPGALTATLECLSESDIKFLSDTIDDVDHPMLKGRMADILWLRKTPKDVKFALKAIDNYRSLDLNRKSWAKDTGDCWKRALILSRMLGGGAGNRVEELEKEFLIALESATKNDLHFGFWLAEALRECKLGRNNRANIAQKLQELGEGLESDRHFREATEYYKLAGTWFYDLGEKAKQTDMKVAIAEAWVQEAEHGMASNNSGAIGAIGSYDNAIQAYRDIPNSEREQRGINQKINELNKLYEETSQLASEQMKIISTSQIDLSEAMTESKKMVSGKEPTEALNHFANLIHINAKSIREDSTEFLRENPLFAFAEHTTLTEDSRVAAKNTGIRLGGN